MLYVTVFLIGDIEQHPGFDSLPTYQTKVRGNTVYVVPSDIVRTSVIRPMTKKLKSSPVFVIIGSGTFSPIRYFLCENYLDL